MLNKPFDRLAARIAIIAAVLSCGVWTANADSYTTAVLADNPISLWQLNETSGTVAHDSAGSFNGSFTNVALGQAGYTAGFDPTNLATGFGTTAGQNSNSFVGGLLVDFATNGNGEFSVEAWVLGGPQAAGAGLVGRGTGGGGEQFYLDCGAASAAFRFFTRNTAGTVSQASSTVTPDGNWHHLVGVCDEANSIIRLYIDGVQKATGTMTGGVKVSANAATIGARQSSASSPYDFQFNGSIEDVAVYPIALSAAQVQAHYFAAGIPPTFTVQPPASLTTNEGSAVTLTAAATGTTPLSYQWLINNVPIPGQTNPVFSTNSISGTYNNQVLALQVTNAVGSITGSGTFLTINSGIPQIVTNVQPASLTLYVGLTNIYSVSAVGTVPMTFQWIKNGSPISGATTTSLTAIASAGTDTYTVSVSNSFGATPGNTVSLIGAPLPSGAYATQVLSDHPISYWRLDESSGASLANEFAGGHTGAYNSTQTGVPGYSPGFDSDTAALFGTVSPTDSYMAEIDNSANGIPLMEFGKPTGSNAQFSVEAWVNGPAGQNPTGSCIIGKGVFGAEEFVLDASSGNGNDFRFYTRKPGTGGTSIINGSTGPDGNWHHLVGVCDEANGGTTLYVDGVPNAGINSLAATGLFSTTTPISVGSQSSGFDYTFNFLGTIDEVAVYNYALTAAQVAAHYNAAPLPPYYTVLPPTNVTAFLGQAITLSASVLGSSPRTNQWFSNSIALSGQTNISLAVNTSHSGTNTYFLKVSNLYGSSNTPATVVSVPAGSGPPTLLTDTTPASSTRYTGLSLTYSVVASGSTPLTYQWLSNSLAIPGATNSSFTIASVKASSAAAYNCVVSNSISTITSTPSTLTVVSAPTNAYPSVVLADHPVAYFRLDEPSNSVNGFDYVGGNVGQYTSLLAANFPQCGTAGYSTNLDTNTACRFGIGGTGVNNTFLGNTISNIDFSQPNGQNGAFSLEAWINGTAGQTQVGGGTIIAKGQGSAQEQFSIDINNGIRFYARTSTGLGPTFNAQTAGTATGSFVGSAYQMDGKWHHVVAVCDQVNSNLLIYLDGHLIGPNFVTNNTVPPLVGGLDMGIPSNGTNGIMTAGTGIEKPTVTQDNINTVSIGNRNKSSAHTGTGAYDLPFLGIIDEVALYNYILTPNQVLNHFNTGSGTRVPLTITKVGTNSIVSWFGSGLLQSSTNVNGAWTNVVGATSPFTNNISGKQFFRLKLN